MALQDPLQVTGSYSTGGRSSLSFKGVYSAEMGTTVLVASIRLDGQAFHENLTPIGGVGISALVSELDVCATKSTHHLCPPRPQSLLRSSCWLCIRVSMRDRTGAIAQYPPSLSSSRMMSLAFHAEGAELDLAGAESNHNRSFY